MGEKEGIEGEKGQTLNMTEKMEDRECGLSRPADRETLR
jgi:hypothetical protein